MKVNMLEAKSQLSKLVQAALEGEEVVIASHGKPMVRLVPLSEQRLPAAWGRLKVKSQDIDAAFTTEIDEEVAGLLAGKP
ncbi:MAG: type II toxin-antitoxin system prevent-host-death family antitoxin [Betaproteobacteria bacterium]|nr:type II toxin-antitoxin system prevent-host-death family antitoxin [Betaproteobacteria bacterium]